MKVSKNLTINLGCYESLKLGVEEASSYQDADNIILEEINRLDIPVSKKIRQCLQLKKHNNR
jgi:hypothetical protein